MALIQAPKLASGTCTVTKPTRPLSATSQKRSIGFTPIGQQVPGSLPNTSFGSLANTRLGFWGWDKGTWGLGVGLGSTLDVPHEKYVSYGANYLFGEYAIGK